MREQLPVGMGYREVVQKAMIGAAQMSNEHCPQNFGDTTMEGLLESIPNGSMVCDVGCAWAGFSLKVKEVRKDIRVISINPAFSRLNIRNDPHVQTRDNLCAAFNPELPFKTGLFDATFDVWGSFYYSYSWVEYLYKLDELLRITKKNGQLFFGPLWKLDEIVSMKETVARIRRITQSKISIYGVNRKHFWKLYV